MANTDPTSAFTGLSAHHEGEQLVDHCDHQMCLKKLWQRAPATARLIRGEAQSAGHPQLDDRVPLRCDQRTRTEIAFEMNGPRRTARYRRPLQK